LNDKFALLGVFVALGGVITLALAAATYRKDSALKNWPTAMATIQSAAVERTTIARLQMPGAHNQFANTDSTYRLDPVWAIVVEYRYRFADKNRLGTKATSAPMLEKIGRESVAPSQALHEFGQRFQPGAQMPVHVNPDDANDSYLLFVADPGLASLLRTGWSLLGAGVLIAAIAKLWPW
jgi:hypothetical protein